ncbi:hypothetical protein HZH66_010507 [Vespula vulgaris]|uniref:Major facilitator superfamily (MFS) profile domain-containing protein n=1 Tax=Vespula vulgaris TaxID=7454 RepID=A0A834MXX2_VESVU|nr:hypothetical protein HZH66_010507 [Vespula vulgaris]
MAEKIGYSKETFVSQNGHVIKAKRFLQYIASFSASLGALAAGMSVSWTSQAGVNGANIARVYNISITAEEFSWIGSLAAFGSAVSCVPIGILADIIGRKYSMLILVIPFTIGWLCIIFANSIALFYVGRFLTGFSGGAFCVTGPMYTSEIAESEIRGRLGLFYQLFLTVGILTVSILNLGVNVFELSVISGFVPIVFGVTFFFMPETPVYYLIKGNEDAARKSYIKFRGPHYDIEPELSMQKRIIEETSKHKVSFLTLLKTNACKKAILISYGLMGFQQFSGVNAVAFYIGPIFETAGGSVGPKEAASQCITEEDLDQLRCRPTSFSTNYESSTLNFDLSRGAVFWSRRRTSKVLVLKTRSFLEMSEADGMDGGVFHQQGLVHLQFSDKPETPEAERHLEREF